jgi:hypothetical protein
MITTLVRSVSARSRISRFFRAMASGMVLALVADWLVEGRLLTDDGSACRLHTELLCQIMWMHRRDVVMTLHLRVAISDGRFAWSRAHFYAMRTHYRAQGLADDLEIIRLGDVVADLRYRVDELEAAQE